MIIASVCKSTPAPLYLCCPFKHTSFLRGKSALISARLQFGGTTHVTLRKFSIFSSSRVSDVFETQSAALDRSGAILISMRLFTNRKKASLSSLRRKKKWIWKSTGGHGKKIVEESKLLARELLDYETIPAGSYTVEHFAKSKKVLVGLKLERATDAESVSLAINVLKRYIFELAEKRYEKRFTKNLHWCLSNHESCLNRIFANWKTALFAKEKVTSVDELMQMLSDMIDKVPEYVVPLEVVEIIVEAAIHEAPSNKQAALAAEEVFNFFKKIAEPNANIYNLIIVAWGKSGLIGFDTKIQQLVTRMFALKVQPNIRTFHLLTELWAELGRTSTLEQTIIAMQKNAFMLPDIFCLWHACRCYAKNGLMDKARYFFDRVLNEYDPSMDSHVDVVKNAAIDIITAYHRFSRDERHFQIERLEALQNAESFIVKIRESDKIRIEIIEEILAWYRQQCNFLEPISRPDSPTPHSEGKPKRRERHR